MIKPILYIIFFTNLFFLAPSLGAKAEPTSKSAELLCNSNDKSCSTKAKPQPRPSLLKVGKRHVRSPLLVGKNGSFGKPTKQQHLKNNKKFHKGLLVVKPGAENANKIPTNKYSTNVIEMEYEI